jgi:hypothetical protein
MCQLHEIFYGLKLGAALNDMTRSDVLQASLTALATNHKRTL